jgi:alpha-amylase
MISVCFYFQVHQPWRLNRRYDFFHLGRSRDYWDDEGNRNIMAKVAEKCYLPANELMLELIERYGEDFRIAYSITGTALEQFQRYAPRVLESFQKLAATGNVEFISETYYHSLAFLFSREEFRRQVKLHRRAMEQYFGQDPVTFRNTELIYNDELAAEVEKMGYRAVLTEGTDRDLAWRSPNFVYQPAGCYRLKVLLKNYRLSDDIAFRFSNRHWPGYPLRAETYAAWLHAVAGNGETINLFMDYETFGEHQWADSGIFQFLRALPGEVLRHPDFRFQTPAEVAARCDPVAQLQVPHFISWADVERDTTAWLGNPLQDAAAEAVFALEKEVLSTGDAALEDTWGRLLTSDHFYYMCTKWFSDGDVHKYFNPFSTPHEAHVIYMNVLNDLRVRLEKRGY